MIFNEPMDNDGVSDTKISAPLRVLLVDDEVRILRALRAVLRAHDVLMTSDPREAVKLAQDHDIDVVICDQRMPYMLGVEVLRDIKAVHPRAMRILLTGYSDLQSVLASVNEGEIFRFVYKPWDNNELRDIVQQAGTIARESPVIAIDQLPTKEYDRARNEVGVLVIEDDVAVQQRLREILQPYYKVRFANNLERGLQILEQFEIGVIISEIEAGHTDMTGFLKAIKQFHPQIATVIVTEKANAQLAIELINEGQVYRMLLKPVRLGSCRLCIEAALGRYWQLKQNPQAARRYIVTAAHDAEDLKPPMGLPLALFNRIRALPGRLLGLASKPQF